MVLVDAGANAECTPEMLVQFAQMASTFVDGALPRRADPDDWPALHWRGVH